MSVCGQQELKIFTQKLRLECSKFNAYSLVRDTKDAAHLDCEAQNSMIQLLLDLWGPTTKNDNPTYTPPRPDNPTYTPASPSYAPSSPAYAPSSPPLSPQYDPSTPSLYGLNRYSPTLPAQYPTIPTDLGQAAQLLTALKSVFVQSELSSKTCNFFYVYIKI